MFLIYYQYLLSWKLVSPRYNWNIVENGVKHHNLNHNLCKLVYTYKTRIKNAVVFIYLLYTVVTIWVMRIQLLIDWLIDWLIKDIYKHLFFFHFCRITFILSFRRSIQINVILGKRIQIFDWLIDWLLVA